MGDLTYLDKLVTGPPGPPGPDSGGVPLTKVFYCDAAFVGTSTGGIGAPYASLQAAVDAAGASDCVILIAPGTYGGTLNIPGGQRFKFIELGFAGIPLVNVTAFTTWLIKDGSEVSWEGCNLFNGTTGPVFKDTGAGTDSGSGRVHWNLIGTNMGIQTNGNAASAAYSHDVALRATYFRTNGFSALSPTAIQPTLMGFDTQGTTGSVGQVQVTEGVLAGPGPYKCGFIRLRDTNAANAQTITCLGVGSSFENASLGVGTVINCTAGSSGLVTFDVAALFYWASNGNSQTGTLNSIQCTALQSSRELTSGSFAVGAGSAAALDLLLFPRQKLLLNSTSCAVSVAKYPVEPSTTVYLRFVQDASGSRAVTWSSDFVGTPTLNTSANAETVLPIYWNGQKFYFL